MITSLLCSAASFVSIICQRWICGGWSIGGAAMQQVYVTVDGVAVGEVGATVVAREPETAVHHFYVHAQTAVEGEPFAALVTA